MAEAISEAQKATRRRALGRKLARQASDLRVMVATLHDSEDLAFLTTKEGNGLKVQLTALEKIATNYDKLGSTLEGK